MTGLQPLFRTAERTHWLFVPGVLFALLGTMFLLLWESTPQARLSEVMPEAQVAGTSLMFSLLPAYLVAMICYQYRVTQRTLTDITGLASAAAISAVQEQMQRLGTVSWLVTLGGAGFGLWQNSYLIDAVANGEHFTVMDAAFVGSNCLLWALVCLLLCWRIAVSRRLAQLSMVMALDLYRLDQLRPLARIATTDVLVVAGAMAMMPLQSLDAQFRIWNYQWGLFIGVPALIVLFLLPLWGLRGRIAEMKARRVAELRAQFADLDRADTAQLELHGAHIERIQRLSNWPIDVQLLTRVFAYVIIPPVAWVAAALVENLVDGW